MYLIDMTDSLVAEVCVCTNSQILNVENCVQIHNSEQAAVGDCDGSLIRCHVHASWFPVCHRMKYTTCVTSECNVRSEFWK